MNGNFHATSSAISLFIFPFNNLRRNTNPSSQLISPINPFLVICSIGSLRPTMSANSTRYSPSIRTPSTSNTIHGFLIALSSSLKRAVLVLFALSIGFSSPSLLFLIKRYLTLISIAIN